MNIFKEKKLDVLVYRTYSNSIEKIISTYITTKMQNGKGKYLPNVMWQSSYVWVHKKYTYNHVENQRTVVGMFHIGKFAHDQ